MDEVPPPFQESARCAVCNSAFSTFKRRHHCRCCGRSLCNEHSSNQMTLPKFGINAPVRVCDVCFASSQQISSTAEMPESNTDVNKMAASIANLDVSRNSAEEMLAAVPELEEYKCSCGMPLCICQTPTVTQTMVQVISTSQPTAPIISKKPPLASSVTNSEIAKPVPSSSYGNSLPSLFFSSSQNTNGGSQPSANKYDATGEGMREAIKSGDVAGVKDLLARGVDPNHCDKQGMSLLHLAAVFNLTEIAFLLMDAGADLNVKNAQGETPIDCAQATLQYKMQQKTKSRVDNNL